MSNLKILVQARPDKIRYSRFEDEKSVSLGYFESSEYTSEKNVIINDFSSYQESNLLEEEEFYSLNKKEFESDYKEVLITDISVKIGDVRHPLFYKAKLKDKISRLIELKKISNDSEANVENGYKLVNGELYTNFRNKYDSKKERSEIYYLRCELVNGETYSGLLNLTKAFEEKTFENKDKSKVYIRTFSNNKYRYRIELSSQEETLSSLACGIKDGGSIFYWKPSQESKLKIKPLEKKFSDEEWLIEITNGSTAVIKNGNYYRYSLPEYKYQTFSPYAPFKKLLNKQCKKVSRRIIKMPYQSIVKDDNLKIRFEYLNNGLETIDQDINVVSVDEQEGFVEVDKDIENDYIIKSDFIYVCKSVILKSLNMNPYFNKEALNTKYIVGILPNRNDVGIAVFKCVKNKMLYHEYDNNFFGRSSIEGLTLEEFYQSKTLFGEGNVNILGEVYFKDNSILGKCLFFDKREKEFLREEKLQDIFTANPKIQHTKYGYGEDGISYNPGNIRFIEIPEKYKNSFEKDINLSRGMSKDSSFDQEIFERRLSDYNLGETKLSINYSSWDPKISIKMQKDLTWKIEVEWDGPGSYSVVDERDYAEIARIDATSEPTDRLISFEGDNLKSITVKLKYEDSLTERSLVLP